MHQTIETAALYQFTSRRFPQGHVVEVLGRIPGTNCFRVDVHQYRGHARTHTAYALASELQPL